MLQDLNPTRGDTAKRAELNGLLELSAESLDVTPTQYQDAVEKYLAVGRWLSDEKSELRIYSPTIYAQGSLALGTVVKPLGRDEFDLDVTCVLNIPEHVAQKQLKEMVGTRLNADKTYREMLEEKTRCWRLNYAGQFHMDIIPAKPKRFAPSPTALLITDKDYRVWKDTDPKGYAKWFQAKKVISVQQVFGAVRASVEPAPAPQTERNKTPLQIAVQLLKRHRDVMFQGRDDAPISIIITTLAGHSYEQEADVLGTMRGLVRRMPEHIEYINGVAYVRNPTNPNENFADKWQTHPERKDAFDEWIAKADEDIDRLEQARGLQNLKRALDDFLGPKRSSIVLQRYSEPVNSVRNDGLRVSVSTGLLGGASGVAVPKNTFFGT